MIASIFLFLLIPAGLGQQGNYPNFDRKNWHFGFALGVNTADFNYRIKYDTVNVDSITNIEIKRQPGFHLSLVGSFDPHPVFHIRFVPTLSFQERLFSYTYMKNGEATLRQNRLESTCLDFPLLIKLRTKRIENFAAYAISGFQYSLDLASQADADQIVTDPFVKIKKHNYAFQVGGGFDFWLPYFKFGIELKMSNGLRNVTIDDGSFFMHPMESLRTKNWLISLTFEG